MLMRLLFLSRVPLAFLALTACSNQIVSTTAAGGSTSTSGTQATNATTGTHATTGTQSTSNTASTGSGVSHGCKTSADCNGNPCVALTPGGYQVCITPPPEATMCIDMMTDQCCTSADCAAKGGGGCYAAMNLQFCGGAQLSSNWCVKDGCMSDADCAGTGSPAICAPAGAFSEPKRECFAAYCKTDADCTTMAGGACVVIGNNGCCKLPAPFGLACVYPGDCVNNTDCGNTQQQCGINPATGRSQCQMAQGCPG
jgi:hypothetical protein